MPIRRDILPMVWKIGKMRSITREMVPTVWNLERMGRDIFGGKAEWICGCWGWGGKGSCGVCEMCVGVCFMSCRVIFE